MDSSSDSRMELFFTAQQPVEFELNVLTMSHEEILNLISATHVSADDNFDVDSLFVDVKKIFQRTFAIFDKLLLGQQYEEIPEEKVSTANFDPVLLCTLKELSSEMACKTPGVEIAHMTTMSILNKLPRYSWVAKAVLTLAASALVYEDFLAPTHLHSSLQRVESMEIPEQAPATLKLLDLQKYKETISKLTSTIREVNDVMRHICELNKLCNNYMKDEPSLLSYVVDDIPAGVYWTIINVVACTTQMCCLSSDEDKTQELLPLAGKECDIRYHLGSCINNCYERIEKAQTRKMKELLQTPDEIVEVFKALIFAKDDMQPLIDGSTNEMVSINVLENKYYVLLFISSLEISNDDISILKRTHDFRGNWGDSYKIVWIPIVEQWTDGLRKKFEMLRSKMPWYVVQYFSPVACIKFIKEEWHFEYKPIVVVIDEQGNVINDNAIDMIRLDGTFIRRAYPTGPPRGEYMLLQRPPGPYAIEEYTFLCGGKDNEWIKQFSEKVNVVAEDPIMKEAYISIELSCIVEGRKQRRFWKLGKTQKMPNSNPGSQEIQKLLLSLKNESRWAVLTKWSTRVVSHHGSTILKVLEAFEEWKVNVPERGFEICFKEFHDKFLQTGSQPLTPRPVEGS